MIRFADVLVGSGGGSCSCSRCHGPSAAPVYRPLDEVAADIAALAAAWQGRPGPNVRLSGAEPFGHPALPAIVAAAVSAGCQRIGVDTDAIALRSPVNAGGALMAGVRHVRFTLLGGAGIHDVLAGTPGVLDATLEGVRSYRSAADSEGLAVSVTALVPVCTHNVHELPSAVGLAVDRGADSVLLRLGGDVDLVGAAPWVIAACDTGVVNGVWVEAEGVPFCLAPGYDLHLADAARKRPGAKPPTCRECALDPVCAGAPEGASAGMQAKLTPPPFAPALAPGIMRSRAGEEG